MKLFVLAVMVCMASSAMAEPSDTQAALSESSIGQSNTTTEMSEQRAIGIVIGTATRYFSLDGYLNAVMTTQNTTIADTQNAIIKKCLQGLLCENELKVKEREIAQMIDQHKWYAPAEWDAYRILNNDTGVRIISRNSNEIRAEIGVVHAYYKPDGFGEDGFIIRNKITNMNDMQYGEILRRHASGCDDGQITIYRREIFTLTLKRFGADCEWRVAESSMALMSSEFQECERTEDMFSGYYEGTVSNTLEMLPCWMEISRDNRGEVLGRLWINKEDSCVAEYRLIGLEYNYAVYQFKHVVCVSGRSESGYAGIRTVGINFPDGFGIAGVNRGLVISANSGNYLYAGGDADVYSIIVTKMRVGSPFARTQH